MTSNPFAFVTLLTSDHYLPGALNLAAALRHVHQSTLVYPDVDNFDIVCLVTPETVDVKSIKLLRRAFDQVVGVEVIEQRSFEGLRLLGRLDLAQVLTKLHVFRLTNYSKIVFLDADVLPLRPLSHLFNLPHEFAAAPDVGWPDIFNSGVMLLTPGQSNFDELTALSQSRGSWDGGDQGLLNEWRGSNWHRLSFTYNTTPTAAYTYAPAYARFGSDIKAIHFIGPNKPWSSLSYRAPFSSSSLQNLLDNEPKTYGYSDLVDKWYSIYDRYYRLQPPPTEPEYHMQKYESAWNAPESVQIPAPEQPLGLEELRRAALEGSSAIHPPASIRLPSPMPTAPTTLHHPRPREGQYSSLPLEGRLDLMRPRPPSPKLEKEDESITPKAVPQTLVPVAPLLPHTEPTPSSQPPPSSAYPPPSQGDSQLLPSPFSRQEFEPLISQQHATSAEDDGRQQQQYAPSPSPPLPEQDYSSPPRPASPPMILWNPAVEPPPSNPPPQNAFVPDRYFENVWDSASTQSKEQADSRGFFIAPPTKVPEKLIKEGHYTNVMHSTAIRPTHQVKASEPIGGAPPAPTLPAVYVDPHRPDKDKVTAVFPWESSPRHVPGRVFPRSASPPPAGTAQYIQPTKASPVTSPLQSSSTFTSPPKEVISSPSSLSPGSIFDPSNFQNAWDAVPSIQRYATRLQRPIVPSPPQNSLSSKGRRSRRGSTATFRSWEELGDSSSHEADVEDEVDEESDDGQHSKTARGDTLSRRVSGSSLSKDGRTGKTYRSQGVQTIKPSRRDKGVQYVNVETFTSSSTSTTTGSISSKISGTSSMRRVTPYHMSIQTPTTGRIQQEIGTPSVDEPQGLMLSSAGKRATAVASIRDPVRMQKQGSSPLGQPARKNTSPPMPPSQTASSMSTTTNATAVRTSSPPMMPRSSDDTVSSSQGSAMSQGPISPNDGQSVPLPASVSHDLGFPIVRRPPGRTWDPARGVDVFKSQSEEVLARFLRMGSWEERSAAA